MEAYSHKALKGRKTIGGGGITPLQGFAAALLLNLRNLNQS